MRENIAHMAVDTWCCTVAFIVLTVNNWASPQSAERLTANFLQFTHSTRAPTARRPPSIDY